LGTIDFLLYSASDDKLLKAADEKNHTSLLSTMRHEIKKKDGFKVDTEDLWHKLAKRIEDSDY
jgi:hypothetical protein